MTLGDAKVGSTVVVTKIEGEEANCISEKLLRLEIL